MCPVTRQRLNVSADGNRLETAGGARTYDYKDGKVPILTVSPETGEQYIANVADEAVAGFRSNATVKKNIKERIKQRLDKDYRSRASEKALERIIGRPDGEEVRISIGGGPYRHHPSFTNVNISPLPEVDVVADAHILPYADNSVDAVITEAVLEHLKDPAAAVREMSRALRPGGMVYSIVPFLHSYHGYPDHYSNFTLSGHVRLYESSGFEVIESGVCVGPVFALTLMVSRFIREFFPAILKRPVHKLWWVVSKILNPLDRFMNGMTNAHVLATTTYLLAAKKT